MSIAVRTVQKLKDGVSGLLTRTDLNSVTNLYNAFERAFRTFSQKASIPEAMTSTIITLYDGVLNYPSVSPIFGSTVRDVRPVGQNRQEGDMVYRKSGEDFDRDRNNWQSGYNITFETENGVNIMRIKSDFTTTRIILDPMSATTGWTTGGTASLLAQDTTFYYSAPASLRLTLTGIGSGYIEKLLTSSIDLTSYKNVGVGFLALEIPTLNLSSVELRVGSDSSNYYKISATQSQIGAWTVGDFLDTPFDLSQSVTVGAPVITAIKYIRITFTTTATITNLRCGYLSICLPSQHKILFTTSGIFSTGGVVSNYITDDGDLILLNDSAYNIYEHECALTVALQEGGTLSGGISSTINAILNGARARNGQVIQLGLYDKFRADNPSEDIRSVGNYYND